MDYLIQTIGYRLSLEKPNYNFKNKIKKEKEVFKNERKN